MDVTERRQADEAFRLIVVGTAATTGNDFFQSLVKHMAQVLRARYALWPPPERRTNLDPQPGVGQTLHSSGLLAPRSGFSLLSRVETTPEWRPSSRVRPLTCPSI